MSGVAGKTRPPVSLHPEKTFDTFQGQDSSWFSSSRHTVGWDLHAGQDVTVLGHVLQLHSYQVMALSDKSELLQLELQESSNQLSCVTILINTLLR